MSGKLTKEQRDRIVEIIQHDQHKRGNDLPGPETCASLILALDNLQTEG